MSIKCIALDLDGTTLDEEGRLSSRTKAALERAMQEGISIVVASGRCLEALPECITALPGISYAITSNGAALYQLPDQKCMRRFSVPGEAIDKLLCITEPYFVTYEAFFEGKAYAEERFVKNPVSFGIREGVVSYIQTTRHSVPDIREFLMTHKEQLDGIDILVPDLKDKEEITRLLQVNQIPVYLTSSVPNRIELASRAAGKHAALLHLLNNLGIKTEETAAFGNADNDAEMLALVKYGMAVENASPDCLKAAWKIVPSNQKDGVAVGIGTYCLPWCE